MAAKYASWVRCAVRVDMDGAASGRHTLAALIRPPGSHERTRHARECADGPAVGSDTGRPLVIAEPESPASRSFLEVAERAAAQVSIASFDSAAPAPEPVAGS